MTTQASGSEGKISENPLFVSWVDSAWIPVLNQSNVLDYFSERTNPFYDRTCNNEILKMQKLGVADVQLTNMQGPEYCLLHVQEPILYVVRKQIRHSPTQVTPVSDYYILAGVIYQAPDIGAVLNSRILTGVSHLQAAFEEARGYSRYHPSRGYWWHFGKEKEEVRQQKKKEEEKEEPSSFFQRRRVDLLLDQLTRQFPMRVPPAPAAVEGPRPENDTASVAGSQAAGGSVKSERGGANNNANNTGGAGSNNTGGEREGGVKRERDQGQQQPQGKRMKTER